MGNVLIVGAGKEGKGYMGDVYCAAGWDVTFLDKDPAVIRALEDEGGYYLTNYRADRTVRRKITNFSAYVCDEQRSCMQAFVQADLITLCIYPEDIAEAAQYLAPCFSRRVQQAPQHKLTILCLTNKNHYMDIAEKAFLDALETDEVRAWFQENVALRDCIVRRGSNATSNASTEVTAQTVASLLIQPPLNCDLSGVEWMELLDNLEQWKDIKLYTYNSRGAVGSFAGYLKGYTTTNQAKADPEIIELRQNCFRECFQAAVAEYGITEEELKKFVGIPDTLEQPEELIYRQLLNPIRKLARHDRLTGPAMLCLKHGIDPVNLIQALANAFAYDDPRDEAAMQIQQWIQADGIEKTVSRVCGVPEGHELAVRVGRAYDGLMQTR